MKKRLLITSIVMMLVVAVALSTATYAWFTSNATVTASQITMTAASNGDDSIFIKWDGGTYGTSITTTKTYGPTVLKPMVPNEIVANQTTLGEGAHQISFKTAKLTTVASDSTFQEVTGTNGVFFATADTGDTPTNADVIYIKNTSTANIVDNVKITATITPNYIACVEGELARTGYDYYTRTGEEGSYEYESFAVTADSTDVTGKFKATAELVRIAVFTKDLTAAGTNDTTSDFILRGVLANTASAPTYFGNIMEGTSQSAFLASTAPYASNTLAATAAASGFNICYDGGVAHTLAANGEVAIKILMWLDGEALNDNTQGAVATVAFSFAAV